MLYAKDGVDSTIELSRKKFFFTGDMLGYINNLEYFNKHRKGILHLGTFGNLRLSYRPDKPFSFSLGIHMRKAYGDKKFFSGVLPLLSVQYNHNNYYLTIGELYSKNQHGLLDAMLREQYLYDPAVEEGFQIRYTGTLFATDVWLSSDLLNSARHREHLGFGNHTTIRPGPFTISCMIYWDHFGGQIYEHPGDPVRDNVTGSGGISYTHAINHKIDALGIELYAIASTTTHDRKNEPFRKGWGGISRLWLSFYDFEASILFYKGHNYETWRGNTIYHTNKPYYHLELKRHLSFGDNLFLEFGFRFDFIETAPQDYFDHTEHQIWVQMGCDWERSLF